MGWFKDLGHAITHPKEIVKDVVKITKKDVKKVENAVTHPKNAFNNIKKNFNKVGDVLKKDFNKAGKGIKKDFNKLGHTIENKVLKPIEPALHQSIKFLGSTFEKGTSMVADTQSMFGNLGGGFLHLLSSPIVLIGAAIVGVLIISR